MNTFGGQKIAAEFKLGKQALGQQRGGGSLKQHNDILFRYSETFYREAQNPVVVVLRGCAELSEDMVRVDMGDAYLTRLHVCNPDGCEEGDDDSSDWAPPYEISGHYDMTWDEAIEDFYRRCIRESTGTDLRPEKQPTYCPFLARASRNAAYMEATYARKLTR